MPFVPVTLMPSPVMRYRTQQLIISAFVRKSSSCHEYRTRCAGGVDVGGVHLRVSRGRCWPNGGSSSNICRLHAVFFTAILKKCLLRSIIAQSLSRRFHYTRCPNSQFFAALPSSQMFSPCKSLCCCYLPHRNGTQVSSQHDARRRNTWSAANGNRRGRLTAPFTRRFGMHVARPQSHTESYTSTRS